MKKIIFWGLYPLIVCFVIISCNEKTETIERERDSVEYENKRLDEFLDIVAFSMDSINNQEKYLYLDRDGRPLTNKERIRNNLKLYKYTLDEQQKRIDALEQQLKNSDDERGRKLKSIISSLRVQLEEKNVMIAQLQEQLEQKNLDIASLKKNVGQLTNNVNSLTQEVEDLNTQNQIKDENIQATEQKLSDMSIGFVVFGTKDQLTSKGLIKGGFLKKKKVQLSNMDNTYFDKVDIRHDTSFNIPGKNAKILTPQPKNSYSIHEEGTTSVLNITNPSQFWEVSRYLIVQYK